MLFDAVRRPRKQGVQHSHFEHAIETRVPIEESPNRQKSSISKQNERTERPLISSLEGAPIIDISR